MPAWSFQPRFRAALLNGLAEAARLQPPFPEVKPKRSTIRRARADGRDPMPGQRQRLWISMRSPARELLGETPPIRRRVGIRIPRAGIIVVERGGLTPLQITRIARGDGFETAEEMFALLERLDGFPLAGFLFRW